MKPVEGVNRVTLKMKNGEIMFMDHPTVYSGNKSYAILGNLMQDDNRHQMEQAMKYA